jgi:peptidoglycan/xylan/chitin deacetylase (PgdA/CDA1 family)
MKRIFLNRKKGGFILLVAAILAISLYWLKGHSAPQLLGETYFSVKTSQKVAALTFDDGPSPQNTPAILDILKRHNVKATFFVLGAYAQQYPDLIQRLDREGHEIGNHSWSHTRLIFKPPSFVRREIERTDTLLRDLGYEGYIPFRAPWGNKLVILPWVLKSMNRPHILFDVIAKDWEQPQPYVITQRIKDQIHPGAIVLLHDGVPPQETGERTNTILSLDLTLQQLKEAGYQLVTISELMKSQGREAPVTPTTVDASQI